MKLILALTLSAAPALAADVCSITAYTSGGSQYASSQCTNSADETTQSQPTRGGIVDQAKATALLKSQVIKDLIEKGYKAIDAETFVR